MKQTAVEWFAIISPAIFFGSIFITMALRDIYNILKQIKDKL
jgi:hypothetical protein